MLKSLPCRHFQKDLWKYEKLYQVSIFCKSLELMRFAWAIKKMYLKYQCKLLKAFYLQLNRKGYLVKHHYSCMTLLSLCWFVWEIQKTSWGWAGPNSDQLQNSYTLSSYEAHLVKAIISWWNQVYIIKLKKANFAK